MSRQLYFDTYPDTLENVVPIREHLWQRLTETQSLFRPVSRLRRGIFSVIGVLVGALERVAGRNLLVQNELREFFALDARARHLLKQLIAKKIVVSWQVQPVQPDLPMLTHCVLNLGTHTAPSGRSYDIQGNMGEGVGTSLNEAMIPALAEALERQSLCVWKETDLIRGSHQQLRKKNAVSPEIFTVYSKEQLASSHFSRCHVAPETPIRWVRAYSLTEDKDCLIPAQPVYLNFDIEYQDEPVFSSATTNGAAAGSSLNDAVVKGIFEAIERDGFVLYWLNRLAPRRVILENHPRLGDTVRRFRAYGLEVHVLDTRTEVGVPSFCGVLVDKWGHKAVSVAASAGLGIEQVIEKLLWDMLKHVHFGEGLKGSLSKFEQINKNRTDVRLFEKRKVLWADASMLPELQFFLEGKELAIEEMLKEGGGHKVHRTSKEELRFLKKRFRDLGFKCYVVNVASKEARRAGLKVAKVIVPELAPLYFDEHAKPLGLRRIRSFPVILGLRTAPTAEADLNMLPHPFI